MCISIFNLSSAQDAPLRRRVSVFGWMMYQSHVTISLINAQLAVGVRSLQVLVLSATQNEMAPHLQARLAV